MSEKGYIMSYEEQYGKISKVIRIDYVGAKSGFYITLKTEKCDELFINVYGYYRYDYHEDSSSWYDFRQTLDCESEIIEKIPDITEPYNNIETWAEREMVKILTKKHGPVTSIKITYHWKYVITAKITVENSKEPIAISLPSNYSHSTLMELNTFYPSWENLISAGVEL